VDDDWIVDAGEEVEFEGVDDFYLTVALKVIRIGLFVAGARRPKRG